MADSGIVRRILGIDPGTATTGYAVIETKNSVIELVQLGVLRLTHYKDHYVRLSHIYKCVSQLIIDEKVTDFAIESPFIGQNAQIALKLGRAQGVAMAAALTHGLEVTEYAPRKVKQSVTGNGNASKEQVSKMILQQLKQTTVPAYFDATDALAVAVCHHYQHNSPSKSTKNWSKFLLENPDRLI
ncbi:MAG: crossover junction endodeoxyribonuclease RuvC [Cytophagales bacterium]|nr:MAG: crossover junction endodeoxyribonuclease RuvC [Cytophagales bacterium]TAF59884.1 MAG: crossover junction endodeoxyribonuclease RuvC [Cytophagales bacterium]